MTPEAKKALRPRQRQTLPQTARSFFPESWLEGPGLKAGDFKDSRGSKAFFVNDPAPEDSRRILGDVVDRGQGEVGPEQNAFGDRELAISAMKFVNRGQASQKAAGRYGIRANKDPRGHSMLGLDESQHVQGGVAKRRPVRMRILLRQRRSGIRTKEPAQPQWKRRGFVFDQLAHGQGQEFEFIRQRVGAVLNHLKIEIGQPACREMFGEIPEVLFRAPLRLCAIQIEERKFALSHKTHAWN